MKLFYLLTQRAWYIEQLWVRFSQTLMWILWMCIFEFWPKENLREWKLDTGRHREFKVLAENRLERLLKPVTGRGGSKALLMIKSGTSVSMSSAVGLTQQVTKGRQMLSWGMSHCLSTRAPAGVAELTGAEGMVNISGGAVGGALSHRPALGCWNEQICSFWFTEV